MSTGTVSLHVVLRAAPEDVYRAFLDAGAMAKWLPPRGFVGQVHHLEPRVGGTYRMTFTDFGTGQANSFSGEYLELVPGRKIRYSDRFDDPALAGEMLTTVTMKEVSCGTDLEIVQQRIPEQVPVELCYLGWQESLSQLAGIVEAKVSG